MCRLRWSQNATSRVRRQYSAGDERDNAASHSIVNVTLEDTVDVAGRDEPRPSPGNKNNIDPGLERDNTQNWKVRKVMSIAFSA
jgi:hypothetical protein